MKKSNYVTVNTDSTMNQTALSNPSIGYHTLKLLEGLRRSYNDVGKKIPDVENLTRPMDYEKSRRLENLKKYREQILEEFNTWSELVKNWASEFPEKDALYGDVIIEYYCDIHNNVSLKNIMEEILVEKEDKNKRSQNLQARIRSITLNQIQKR